MLVRNRPNASLGSGRYSGEVRVSLERNNRPGFILEELSEAEREKLCIGREWVGKPGIKGEVRFIPP